MDTTDLTPEKITIDTAAESANETPPVKNRKTSPGNFLKNKRIPIIIIAIVLAACLIAILALSIIRAVQAEPIKEAQIGKCYMVNYVWGDSYKTEIYCFRENEYSHIYISYLDAERRRSDYVSGSVSEKDGDLTVKISLFGEVKMDGLRIELDENNTITKINYLNGPCELISIEQALAIEKQALRSCELTEICSSAMIGVNKFSTVLKEDLGQSTNKPSATASNDQYISAAEALLSKHLKNPNSATYHSKTVVEKDNYGRAIVYLDVSAQNSFGGYTRAKYYICLQSVTTSRYTYLDNYWYVENQASLTYLKSVNDWNEDPTVRYDASDFLPGTPVKQDSVKVNGYILDRYILKSKQVTYTLYVDQDSQYVVAAELAISKEKFAALDGKEQVLLRRAVSVTMQSVHNLLSPPYSKVFSEDTGLVTNMPHVLSCNCVYHAVEKNGEYHISATNAEALGYDGNNSWTPCK